MRIFLLGHRGFISSHLLPRLESLGHEVVYDMRHFDDKYGCIINMAAVTHIKNEFDPKLIESNIILMNKVFKRTERIIYASSCSAAHFTNPYAWSKMWAEYLGEKHGNALGLRFHNAYGPGNNKGIVWWLMQQPDGAEITIRGASVVRDYIYVDDVVNAVINHINTNPVSVNVDELQKESKNFTPHQLRQMIFESNIVLGDFYKIYPATGVVDVGTGLGTKTIDLIKLYMNLSGKKFYDIFLNLPEDRNIDMALDGLGDYMVCPLFVAIQIPGYSDNVRQVVDYSNRIPVNKIFQG